MRAQQHALVRARERAQARPEPGQRRERERGVRPGAEHERERGGERPAHPGGAQRLSTVVCVFCLFGTLQIRHRIGRNGRIGRWPRHGTRWRCFRGGVVIKTMMIMIVFRPFTFWCLETFGHEFSQIFLT